MAAMAAGVPVAEPLVEHDPTWLGAPFIVMPRVEGHIVGELALADPWLRSLDEPARARVHQTFVATLAAIHRSPVEEAPAVPRRDDDAELDHWERYLDWSSDGAAVPVLTDALRWCRTHHPGRASGAVLLWGDVRLENVVLDDDGEVRAVLDWDMASVGSPEHDLAWLTSLETTAAHLVGKRLRGFPDREGTIAAYELASGRTIADLDWYETFAMLRSTAIMTRIGRLQEAAGTPPMLPVDDNPILDLLAARIA
jgi:aminoglycoside phosphotransferase (APT) family kinase protein